MFILYMSNIQQYNHDDHLTNTKTSSKSNQMIIAVIVVQSFNTDIQSITIHGERLMFNRYIQTHTYKTLTIIQCMSVCMCSIVNYQFLHNFNNTIYHFKDTCI